MIPGVWQARAPFGATLADVPAQRMNREQFYGKLATFDEQRLKKALWNIYWRGSATLRERVEAELDPRLHHRKKQLVEAVDPEEIAIAVRAFAELARGGAYMGGDRRVSARERTRWRFTFQQLARDAQNALRTGTSKGAAEAVEQLIELAREMRDYDYFRSEDPIEAAQFVVSDAVARLWWHLREEYGFGGFAERAAPQLIRWESRYGWTRGGWGRVSAKEVSLASVLTSMLTATDMWLHFADRYLGALDELVRIDPPRSGRGRPPASRTAEARTEALAKWNALLAEKLAEFEAADRLNALLRHAALGGPELLFLRARVQWSHDDIDGARKLVGQALRKLPGHPEFLDFAREIAEAGS